MKLKLRTKNENLRRAILNEPIPWLTHEQRNQKRDRVLVRTVGDLQRYCNFIFFLFNKYKNFYGHKKAIGELLGVSTNRIGENKHIILDQ